MRHINQYPAWPNGWRKKESGLGPLSGTLIEQYDARYALDPHDLVTPGNPWGVPNFLWINDDGTGATIGPVGLNLAVTGGVTAGQPFPYQYPNGVDATIEVYDGTGFRRDLVRRISPADSNDIVAVVKYKYSNYVTAGTRFLFSNTQRGTGGFGLRVTGGNFGSYQTDATWAERESVPAVGGCFPRTANVGGFIMNKDGNTYAYANAVQGPAVVTLAGSMVGDGIAIGNWTTAGGIVGAGAGIEWIAVWYADGLYETWIADSSRLMKRLHWEALGLRETLTNSKYWAYSQSGGGSGNVSGRSYVDHNGRWAFSSSQTPRAGNPNGCVVSPYTGNNTVGGGSTVPNYDPYYGVGGWTATGGVFDTTTDTVALAAAKAEIWGPNVFRFTNATGSAQTVYRSTSPALNSVCDFMVIARYSAGANALIGWWDVSAASFTSVGTILGGYALTAVYRQTAAQADWRFAIQVPDGCTLLFIGHALLDDSGYTAYPPPYLSSPWDPEAQREILTTEHTPIAGTGSYLVNLAPLAWSGTACGVDNSVLPCVTTAGDILHAESAAPGWATSDGTVQIAAGNPTAGVYVNVWSAWKAALQYIQQGLAGAATTGAYDGNKGVAGAMSFAPTILGGDYAVKTIQVRNVA